MSAQQRIPDTFEGKADAWIPLARNCGIKEAAKRSREFWVDMTAPEREETRRLVKDAVNGPCYLKNVAPRRSKWNPLSF